MPLSHAAWEGLLRSEATAVTRTLNGEWKTQSRENIEFRRQLETLQQRLHQSQWHSLVVGVHGTGLVDAGEAARLREQLKAQTALTQDYVREAMDTKERLSSSESERKSLSRDNATLSAQLLEGEAHERRGPA